MNHVISELMIILSSFVQITYMEKDMDTDIPQILCTKIDEHAGAWPSESFVSLFRTARKCVEPKMHSRPEIHEVYNY